MYRDIAQWAMVRRKVLEEGVPRRQIAHETGISRKTIRKMLLHKLPQPYGPRTPRYPLLGAHTKTLDELASLNDSTPPRHRLSVREIHKYLQQEEQYSGSYGAIRDYLKYRLRSRRRPDPQVWSDLYETIISLKKPDAVALLRALSCNEEPLIPSVRVRNFLRHTEKLGRINNKSPAQARIAESIEWIHRVQLRE